MRTISIIGTDWTGPDPSWLRQPWLDGGRLSFDRRVLEDWRNVLFELANCARIDAIAVGIRGAYTPTSIDWWEPALDAYRTYAVGNVGGHGQYMPALCPWYDTVGLPDMVNPPGEGIYPFDFLNDDHLHIGWEAFARIFFDIFVVEAQRRGGINRPRLERSKNNRPLCAWWGIATHTGHGFTNQRYAQRLLDRVDGELVALGIGPADHIVDKTWLEYAPDLRVYGVHDWFNPWGAVPQTYSLRTHRGVTTGVVVPSFYRIVMPLDGKTLSDGLAACRAGHADHVLVESGTNFQEAAELMRSVNGTPGGDASKLDVLRAHMNLIHPEDPPMDAVTAQPLLDWVLFESLVPGVAPGRYALPFNMDKGPIDPGTGKPTGQPDPNSRVYLCVNPDGTYEAKPTIGDWESSQPVSDGDREIFFVTENAEKTLRAMMVFGLHRFARPA